MSTSAQGLGWRPKARRDDARRRWRRLWERVNPFAVPRRRRDWIVDSLVFVLSIWLVQAFTQPFTEYWSDLPPWWIRLDVVAGVLATIALWWRRRYPVAVVALLAPLGGLFLAAGFAALVSVFTVAVLRRFRVALLATAVHLVIAIPYYFLVPLVDLGFPVWVLVMILVYVAVLSLGLAVRSRRQVIIGLVTAAERDREVYKDRLQQARRSERTLIAREMHDVLAHRLSLLSVHAGALEFRTRSAASAEQSLSAAELQESVSVIRTSAHQALDELHEVLTVLGNGRPDENDVLGAAPPQPRLADLSTLVSEARSSGQQVHLRLLVDPDQSGSPRGQLQRSVFRVAQEGLTNARKHAPGAEVDLVVSGAYGEEIRVEVTNPLPIGKTSSEIPGAGTGLTGLTERVRLEGGSLTHEAVDGYFVLTAVLPWRE